VGLLLTYVFIALTAGFVLLGAVAVSTGEQKLGKYSFVSAGISLELANGPNQVGKSPNLEPLFPVVQKTAQDVVVARGRA